jgi:hypothetical protein
MVERSLGFGFPGQNSGFDPPGSYRPKRVKFEELQEESGFRGGGGVFKALPSPIGHADIQSTLPVSHQVLSRIGRAAYAVLRDRARNRP